LPYSGKSIRLGITGVPGAGKSTFIEALGVMLVNKGHKLAVLAVDPSSELSKGTILGDKTRMEELSIDPDAFIRPSPSGLTLGGVARKTRETIILCEAAGFDITIVETVGVGQSETAVHGMVDFFLLIQLANTGDELQGIKRGIMEMADAIAINKADGDNIPKAKVARTQFSNALHLFPPTESGWVPVVETCSAYTKDGIENIWNIVQNYITHTQSNNYFEHKRREQSQRILSESIDEALLAHFYHNSEIKQRLKSTIDEVLKGHISPYVAANQLLKEYFQ
jgi:LAO/AO transport system kinase